MAKQYTLMLNTGYAESGAIYYTPFQSMLRHKNAKQALISLAEWLKKNFEARHTMPACCKSADSDHDFCPRCGRRVREVEFDADDFRSYIVELCRCTNDDIGANEYLEEDYYMDSEWQIGFIGSKNIRIVFNAEEVMSAAIGHSSREDITFEDVCNKRTKNKSEDFCFW